MKLVGWMLSGAVLSSFIIAILPGMEAKLELWLGMLGPLASALISWTAMQRQYVRRPEGLTSVLIKAFAAKMIFFAGYIIVIIRVGLVRPIPFAISFTGYFLALHALEAIGLHRLQAAGLPAQPGSVHGQPRNG